MNVLFLSLGFPERSDRNIYSDLMQEFGHRGNQVYVVCQRERRFGKQTELNLENGIHVLRVKTGNITKTNVFEKGISTVLIESQFKKAIIRYFRGIKFDLILYSTPPITFEKVVKFLKNRDNCKTYLLLKDIFPQNAVDIGMIKRGSFIWRYFRMKEKRLYKISDYIGCMSKANVEYVLKHNPGIDKTKVEICPNSINPSEISGNINKDVLREKYGIPTNAVTYIYGGNLGRPQGIDFVIEVIDYLKDRSDIFFLLVGSGTEYYRLYNYIQKRKHHNVMLIEKLPKDEYDQLLQSCDVGLIFLDPRFTIPNFPSRLTAYMEYSLPVVAATDVNSDLKDTLEQGQCGGWTESGDLLGFTSLLEKLAKEPDLRLQMGKNGRKYLEEHYSVVTSYEIITKHISNDW